MELRFFGLLATSRDDTQPEGVGTLGQIGVFLDAAVGVGAPVFFRRTFESITVLYGLGNVIIAGAIFQPDGIVAPSDDGWLLATVEEGVGILADIYLPDIRMGYAVAFDAGRTLIQVQRGKSFLRADDGLTACDADVLEVLHQPVVQVAFVVFASGQVYGSVGSIPDIPIAMLVDIGVSRVSAQTVLKCRIWFHSVVGHIIAEKPLTRGDDGLAVNSCDADIAALGQLV